jgi:hypothetical protein
LPRARVSYQALAKLPSTVVGKAMINTSAKHIAAFRLSMANNIKVCDFSAHKRRGSGEAADNVYASHSIKINGLIRSNDMSAQSFAEMRMEPRWQLKSTVSVFQKGGSDCLGLLVNWSKSGLMISSYQPLKSGDSFDVELVDILQDNDRRTAPCKIEVVWCKELNPSLYGSGCRLVEGSEMFDAMMQDYCDE